MQKFLAQIYNRVLNEIFLFTSQSNFIITGKKFNKLYFLIGTIYANNKFKKK